MNGGGPIPWNAFAFCETSKTSWVMGKHHVEDDFGESFKGLIIPFGSLIEYHPISPKYQTRVHQFGKKVLPGVFLGYAVIAGGIWKGDVLVADMEDLEKFDASDVHPRRINAKEILIRQTDDEFIFPIADGTAKLSGKDYEFREFSLRREPTRKERRSQWRTSRRTGRVSTDRNHR